jgi:fatty-acyl-CoA synthase
VLFVESIGGSEMGLQAMSHTAGQPVYQLRDNTVILSDDYGRILDPGEGTTGVGWIASSGHLPLGYLGDPDKTKRTFPTINGVRYVVSGDRACYQDGAVVFLGRESVCINTGGEKVYVEEVERVVKSHPAIYDVLVVGVPHERWGQQVTAVVSLNPGRTAPEVQELRAHCRAHLADYKIPRALVVAPEIVRSPSGKPDYAWATEFASA